MKTSKRKDVTIKRMTAEINKQIEEWIDECIQKEKESSGKEKQKKTPE